MQLLPVLAAAPSSQRPARLMPGPASIRAGHAHVDSIAVFLWESLLSDVLSALTPCTHLEEVLHMQAAMSALLEWIRTLQG
jgi:hypothetical protein